MFRSFASRKGHHVILTVLIRICSEATDSSSLQGMDALPPAPGARWLGRPSERVPFDGKEESSSGVCQGHNTTRLTTIVSEDVSDMSVSPDVNGGRQGRTKERVQRGTCEGCGQRVFVGERRMRHANGTYFHKGCYKRGVSAGHGTADSRSSSGARFGAGPNPRIAAIEMSQIPSPLAYAMWA
jgi:hypothetical protein